MGRKRSDKVRCGDQWRRWDDGGGGSEVRGWFLFGVGNGGVMVV